MRLTCWTFVAVSLAVSIYAKDTATCIEPSAVAAFETKISDLEQVNHELQLQIATEKSQLLTDVTKEHETAVQTLQKEIAMLQKDVEKLEKDVMKEKKTGEKVEHELKTVQAKLKKETKRVSSRESDVTKLRERLAKEQGRVATTKAELQAALIKLAEETKRTQELEKGHQIAEQKNQALMKELANLKPEELNMATVLSFYYDSALELAEQSVVFAQEKINEHSNTLEQVQSKIDGAKKTAYDTTNKFYQENLAATLDPILEDVRKKTDPILADVHKAVSPHVEQYLPIVQNEAVKAKEQAVLYSREALHRAKLARMAAITFLTKNEHVAPYAQKVIDSVLFILAVPLVLFQIRVVLRLVWWLVTTALCVMTCGLCCGARDRSSKMKRKTVKKATVVNASLNAPVNGPTKKTTGGKVALTTQKRSKKGKN
ncbi:unnamed protein product [Peronospora destructor]|uniref:Uncharacterized protein n=1 Tax=Peronospora destructor TaxID=86335 RepID=A0AAV0UXM1_9STRA|nr:unnamed protein product [Peronospora destructor]